MGPWSELFRCREGGDPSNELRDTDSEKVAALNVDSPAENLVVCVRGDWQRVNGAVDSK